MARSLTRPSAGGHSLAQSLAGAARVVARVLEGKSLDHALSAETQTSVPLDFLEAGLAARASRATFDRAVAGATRSLSGQFETADDVLTAMQLNDLYKRPDDYYATLPTRLRALTLPELRSAAAQTIKPGQFSWIVVGDAAKVKPQLDTLGLPVEVIPASAVANVTPSTTAK